MVEVVRNCAWLWMSQKKTIMFLQLKNSGS